MPKKFPSSSINHTTYPSKALLYYAFPYVQNPIKSSQYFSPSFNYNSTFQPNKSINDIPNIFESTQESSQNSQEKSGVFNSKEIQLEKSYTKSSENIINNNNITNNNINISITINNSGTGDDQKMYENYSNKRYMSPYVTQSKFNVFFNKNNSNFPCTPYLSKFFMGNKQNFEAFNKSNKPALDKNSYRINIEDIIKGVERRTTVMIKNIPNKYTTQSLLNEIKLTCENKYDYFYLPMDPKNNCNKGYCFINFTNFVGGYFRTCTTK